MTRHARVPQDPLAVQADQHIGQVLARIADYSRDYHEKQPNAPLRHCIEIGAGRVSRGSGNDEESRLVQLALAEMAARWVFESHTSKEPAE